MQGSNLKKFITIRQLDGTEHQYKETDLPLILGAGKNAHIIIPAAGTSAAFIGSEQGHLFIQPSDIDKYPTFLNNQIITSSSWLKSSDTVQYRETLINCHISGDKITFTVMAALQQADHHTLLPPSAQPSADKSSINGLDIPVNIRQKSTFSTKMKLVSGTIGFAFLLLILSLTFILFAKPLDLQVSPEPDSVSISGFTPALKIGSAYLCLPGTYAVVITKKGYRPFNTSHLVTRKGHNTFTVLLEKLPGRLLLDLVPVNGVKVYADDILLGSTPSDSFMLPPGKHRLKLVKERYQTYSTDLVIEGGNNQQTLKAVLQPDWAEITINSTPPQASVFADHNCLGQTPLTAELLHGDRDIVIKKEHYAELKTVLNIEAGKPKTYSFTMDFLPGKLSIITTPQQSAITIDSKYLGSTPQTLNLSSKSEHRITVHNTGYKPWTKTINLDPGEEKTLNINLVQEQGVIYLATHPPNASVSINGKHYNMSQGRFLLPTQKQIFQVSAPGYKDATRSILPKTGFSQQITIDLVAETEAAQTYPTVSEKQQIITTTGGQKMIRIKPSLFSMGAPRREPGRRANERERTVAMERPFYLSEKPVTNGDYRMFKKDHSSGTAGGHTLNNNDQPVVNISWEDAVAFLNWLSRKEGLQPFYVANGESFIPVTPPTKGYRLPTESEWAFAARLAGNAANFKFPWGDTFPPQVISGNFADESAREIVPQIIEGYNDGFVVSSPVGPFQANSGGFYDIGGNISEWCHDFYTPYTNNLTNTKDPFGPVSGLHRVVRGSSWRDATIKELRLSYRSYSRKKNDTIGFRIARYQ